MERRDFLVAVGATAGLALGAGWSMLGTGRAGAGAPYGPLQPPDGDGLALPAGFRSRVVATTGRRVPGTPYRWHANPDGGATFPTPGGGWVYASNDESGGGAGGVGVIEFDAAGRTVGARRILDGTSRNCAGGPTPWGTWLSCEEHSSGLVWECDPSGAQAPVARAAMGTFVHEAAAVDPGNGVVYLTEDRPDGGLYRFVPRSYPDLSAGTLEILVDAGGSLSWAAVPEPASTNPATKDQVAGARRFDGGEGAWFHDEALLFTTKGDGRVWSLDPAMMDLTIVYDDSAATDASLTGVDNVTVAAASGHVFVAEDGGNLEICVLGPTGAAPFLRLTGVTGSELTGPAFSPDGTRLYFSSQRSPGRTYEVTGPFHGASTAPSTATPSTAAPSTAAATSPTTTASRDAPTPTLPGCSP